MSLVLLILQVVVKGGLEIIVGFIDNYHLI